MIHEFLRPLALAASAEETTRVGVLRGAWWKVLAIYDQ